MHRAAYQAQLDRMKAGGSKSRPSSSGPTIVHAVLRHALLSQRPKPHYVVTWPARVGVRAEASFAGGDGLPHPGGASRS